MTTTISFFEIEKWEEEYLREKLGKNKSLVLNFFSDPLEKKDVKKIKDSDILAVFIYSKINKNIIRQLPNLKFIATMSTGFDHIDLGECDLKKIQVSNVPFYGENTVAEHTFALILALSRKIVDSAERTKKGNFELADLRGFDLNGKTLGIIGFGHIGRHAARIAKGMGMKILIFDPNCYDGKLVIKRRMVFMNNLEGLLQRSDIISLHAPYNSSTHHLINSGNIENIKRGAYLINTARGGLVETEALASALENGILAGAGLDVFEEENFIKEEKELLSKPFQKKRSLKIALQNHLLLSHPKVLVTPHNAFNSEEALLRILDMTVENIRAFLKGKPKNLVSGIKK